MGLVETINGMSIIQNIFYLQIDGKNGKWPLEEYSSEAIEEVLNEEFFYDDFQCLLKESPSYKLAKGHGFIWEDLDDIYIVNESINKGKNIYIYNDENKIIDTWPLTTLYKKMIENFLTSENGEIAVCSLWANQVDNFIMAGNWHVGLISDDNDIIENIESWPDSMLVNGQSCWYINNKKYEPIMWFGIKKQKILSEWVMQENGLSAIVKEENGMGSYGGQMRINGLEINYLELFTENDGSWYFGACGNKGADFHKVVESCPIDLPSVYLKGNGKELVSQYLVEIRKTYTS